MPTTPSPNAAPQVKTIGVMQPLAWLLRGCSDIAKSGWLSLAHGLVLALFILMAVGV